MGIIDIDEDQDEDGDESQDDDVSEEVDQRETSISRSGSVYSHFRSPIRSLSHHHSESNKSSTPRTQSSSNSGGQRIAQLERRLRDAEGQVEVEKRNREMAEREVRDLQSSLYAPVAKEETKRKRRSGADDDLERCLLQYAIKKSRVDPLPNDDDDFDAYLLQYAIAASNGMSFNFCSLRFLETAHCHRSQSRQHISSRQKLWCESFLFPWLNFRCSSRTSGSHCSR